MLNTAEMPFFMENCARRKRFGQFGLRQHFASMFFLGITLNARGKNTNYI